MTYPSNQPDDSDQDEPAPGPNAIRQLVYERACVFFLEAHRDHVVTYRQRRRQHEDAQARRAAGVTINYPGTVWAGTWIDTANPFPPYDHGTLVEVDWREAYGLARTVVLAAFPSADPAWVGDGVPPPAPATASPATPRPAAAPGAPAGGAPAG